jgi:uncharacterized protein (TIGR03437 family)
VKRVIAVILVTGIGSAASYGPVRSDISAIQLCYSQTANLLYVLTSPSSAHLPNSVVALDPITGNDADSIALGVAAGIMAASDDGIHMYVYIPSTGTIRRLNLSTHQTDFEFAPGSSMIVVNWMAVVPGDPDRLVVAYADPSSDAGMAVYVQGNPLPSTVPDLDLCTTFTFGATADTVWCNSDGGDLLEFHLDSTGLNTAGQWTGLVFGFSQVPQFYDGRLYFNSLGQVVDTEAKTIAGQYPYVGTPAGGWVVDGAADRVYYSRYYTEACVDIWAMDALKFIPTGHLFDCDTRIVSGPMVRIGAGGLAMIGTASTQTLPQLMGSGGPIAFYPLSAIPPLAPVSPGPLTLASGGVLRLALPNAGLSMDSVSGRLFASVPDSVPGIGNTIVPIDAATLTPGMPVWIGSRPLISAISDDGQYLYEGFDGSNIVQRLDLQQMVPDFAFPIYSTMWFPGSPTCADGLLTFPGQDDTVAVARVFDPTSDTPQGDSVAVYDHGVPRPEVANARVDHIQWDSTGTILYAFDDGDPGVELLRFQTAPSGVTFLDNMPVDSALSGAQMQEVRCQGDVCFDAVGDVLDGATQLYLGRCVTSGGRVLPDLTRSRVWYLTTSQTAGDQMSVNVASCDLTTFLPAESLSLPAQNASAVELLFANPDTFAIATGSEVITAPRAAATPVAQTPLPQPVAIGQNLKLNLQSSSGAYDSTRDRLYVTISSFVGTFGNSIGVINPSTGVLESTIPVGGWPVLLALTSDDAYLWVALQYSHVLVRLNLATRMIDLRVQCPDTITALAALPGQDASVAVSTGYLGTPEVQLYDSGVQRGAPISLQLEGADGIAFNSDGTLLFVAGGFHTFSFNVTPSGLTANLSTSVVLGDSGSVANAIQFFAGRLYGANGNILDAGTLSLVDALPDASAVTPDAASGRIYLFWASTIYAYDGSLTLLATYPVPNSGPPIIPCGASRFALLGQTVFLVQWSTMTQAPSLTQLSSAAGGVPALAPGSLASAYGTDLATLQGSAQGLPWPTSLLATYVTIVDSNGVSVQAPLLYASPGQVNFQIPTSVALGVASATVISSDGTRSVGRTTLTSLAPALFTLNAVNLAAAYAVCVSTGGGETSEEPFHLVNGAIVAQPLNLGACDQTILELLGTGMDKATAAQVQVTIGGATATVQQVGPEGAWPGLDQINVLIPQSLAGRGNVPIILSAGGMIANTVNVTIQ